MRLAATFLALALAAAPAAQAQSSPEAEAQALELLKRGIAFRTVAGEGNQTFDYATYLRGQLVAGGFAESDVTVERMGDTAYLVARYRGSGKAKNGAKPILLSGHMDVVEAKRAEWERDPFTAVVENGYVWGRGASDNKYDISTMVATLIQLKREGFVPGRDILLLASGDEETAMATTKRLSEQFHDAELLLNIDAGGGEMDENNKPVMYGLQGAEKTYADYELTVTDAGGHSSAPTRTNPIYALARTLAKIEAHQFPGEINAITRASFEAAIPTVNASVATAIRRFLANPNDAEALAQLRAMPGMIGQTGTTCVATMMQGGHAANALPQTATATINCRIFPGTKTDAVGETLKQVIADPVVKLKELDTGTIASDASPLRPDLMRAVTRLIHARFPGIPIVPAMSSGATDSMWFRAKGVPSYGISPVFAKASDAFAHGLNERTPLSEIGPSITYYRALLKDLAK